MEIDLRRKKIVIDTVKKFNNHEVDKFVGFLKINKSNIEVVNFLNYMIDVEYDKIETFHPNLMKIIEDKELFNKTYSENKFSLLNNNNYSTKDQFNSSKKDKKPQNNKFNLILKLYLTTIFILITFLFFNINPPLTYNELYNKYYETYPNVMMTRSINNENLEQKTFHAYNNNKWDLVKKNIPILISNNPEKIIYKFYMGIVCLELNQPKEAIKNFKIVLDKKNHLYYEQTYWYMGLSYLKIGEINKSKYYFKQIVNEDMVNSKQAKEILKNI